MFSKYNYVHQYIHQLEYVLSVGCILIKHFLNVKKTQSAKTRIILKFCFFSCYAFTSFLLIAQLTLYLQEQHNVMLCWRHYQKIPQRILIFFFLFFLLNLFFLLISLFYFHYFDTLKIQHTDCLSVSH